MNLGNFRVHPNATKTVRTRRTNEEFKALKDDVLQFITNHPRVTTDVIVEELGQTSAVVQNVIRHLKNDHQIFPTSRRPYKYMAFGALTVTQEATEPVPEPYVPENTFTEEIDRLFVAFANNYSNDLPGANSFRRFIHEAVTKGQEN